MSNITNELSVVFFFCNVFSHLFLQYKASDGEMISLSRPHPGLVIMTYVARPRVYQSLYCTVYSVWS